jgi:iron complex outermembrane recepter protein
MRSKRLAFAAARRATATLSAVVLLFALLPSEVAGAAPGEPEEDLSELSLEELLNLEVTIASKSKQKLSEVPAAVYVLSGEEIRRSGHSSIPEALRMVPGFYVSHWTTGAWDVTSRGFGPGLSATNAAFLNQLLILIDGVVVYSPLFAGTWWPLQDIDLNDVDRIEIVRGPGGILWGSNAVHGVVHVITKKAADTQGFKAYVRGANDDRHGSLRYGAPIGENGAYRAYVKLAEYDTAHNPFADFGQDWNMNSAGMRADWSGHGKDFTVWSRGYFGEFEMMATEPITFATVADESDKLGFQLFGSMSDLEAGSTWQAWFTTDRQDIPSVLDQAIDSFDFEYHRDVEISNSSRLLYGGGYRMIHSDLEGDDPAVLAFDPETQTQNILRVFAVDTVDVSDEVQLVAGLTLEHNTFTEFEVQPTLRASWSPTEHLTTWASVSRAVRTPSLEENSIAPGSSIAGSTSFKSEVLWAYEVGVRAMLGHQVSTDLTAFYNDYDHLHNVSPDPVLGAVYDNSAEGSAYGAELALDVRPFERWNIRSAFTVLQGDYEVDGVDLDTDDQHPEQQINVRSYLDLGYDLELDSAVYVVDKLGGFQEIAEYTRVDVRLGWKPSEELQLFLGVQNLNQDTHSEYDEFDNPRRSVFFGLQWEP